MAVFDSYASDYDAWYKEKTGKFVDQVETDLAFGMIEVKAGMRVLDIGCGTGNFSIKLAEKGCQVVGVDVSEEMLTIARHKAKKKQLSIQFIQGDIRELPLKKNEFDLVLSMAALEFIDPLPEALQKIFTFVKPGGKMLLGTINRQSAWGELYQSEAMQQTVYQFANFKTKADLTQFKPEKIVASGQCLFVAPTAKAEEFTLENEQRLSKETRGGYLCVLWKK